MSRIGLLGLLAAFALLVFVGNAQVQTTAQMERDPVGTLHALETAADPHSAALRKQIEAGPSDLAKARAALAQDGVLLDPASLQKPLPLEGQNAAPLYAKLFQLLKDKPLGLPIYAQPLGGPRNYTPEQIAAVQKIYDSRPKVWALVHQAADSPQCVFTHDWARGASVSFTEFQQIREAARLLNTETSLLAASGKYAEAVKNQTRGLKVAEHAGSDPILLSYLVGVACEAIALHGMQNILDQAGPNAEVAAEVRQAIETNRPHLSLRYALAGETAFEAIALQQMRDGLGRDGLRGMAAILSSSAARKHLMPGTAADRLFAQKWLDASEAIILTHLRLLVDASELTPTPRRQAFASVAAMTDVSPTVLTFLASQVLPSFVPVESDETRRAAQEEVTIAGAAILAVRAKTGVFPDALPEVFADPYTSKPLGYRREGADGFVVYSVGPDGHYDGGKPDDKRVPEQTVYRYSAPNIE